MDPTRLRRLTGPTLAELLAQVADPDVHALYLSWWRAVEDHGDQMCARWFYTTLMQGWYDVSVADLLAHVGPGMEWPTPDTAG